MKRVIKQVPASAYETVKFSAGDKPQLALVVAQVISASNVNWTNTRSAKYEIANKMRSVPESYFYRKYQSFDGVVAYWTTPGRYLGSSHVSLAGIYALIAAGLLAFFGGGTLSLIPLSIAPIIFCVAWVLKTFEYEKLPPKEILKVKATFIEAATKFCDKEVEIQLQKLLYASQSNNPKDLFNSVEGRWQPLGPRPVPQDAGMSPQDAEHFVAEYLRFYGAAGVSVTRFSRDGGIDVETTHFVAQVKHVQANVGVKAVREIYAIAVSKNKEALFFAKVGYTKDAIDFATQNRIALFTYLPHLKGYEPRAKTYLEQGMACSLDF